MFGRRVLWAVYLCAACGGSSGAAKNLGAKDFSVKDGAGRSGGSVILPNPAMRGAAGQDAEAQAGRAMSIDNVGVAEPKAGARAQAGAAGAAASDACDEDDAMRCSAGGAGRRERCQAGHWKSTSGCTQGEVCTSTGDCQPVSKLCLGSAGQAVCDGTTLYLCNPDGTQADQRTCGSARQCQAGIAARDCAACSPGDYRCSAAKLERCTDDGQGWSLANTCDSVGLCNASAHACTKSACLPNTFTCVGDALRKCKDDQTGFDDPQPCAPGTCDSNRGECLSCVPGKKSCDGATALTCNADGSSQEQRACTGTTPHCSPGNGACVECTSDGECQSPTQACRAASCNLGTGVCEQQSAAEGSDCALPGLSGGRCNGQGSCVECLDDSHCEGKLGRSRCNALSDLCSACATDDDCDTDNFKGCSLLGQCVDVAGCGNRVVDVLAGEECDPTAPEWSTLTCDPSTCARRIYQSCGVLSGRCARDQCTAARVCARACVSSSDCTRLPGYSPECSDAGECYLPCDGQRDRCPIGLFCNTDLQPPQCAGVL